MNHRIFVLFISVLLGACSANDLPEVNQELSRKLVGNWSNSVMKLDMKTYKNADSATSFETNSENWEEKMKIRPIVTSFKTDGTYNSLHKNLRDSVIYNPAGKWMIVADSLHMMDTFPAVGPVYRYKLKFKANNTIELTGQEDCDGDGKADDFYFSRQVRL